MSDAYASRDDKRGGRRNPGDREERGDRADGSFGRQRRARPSKDLRLTTKTRTL